MYTFQSDISTNNREIKYQNIEKSLSLIIERMVSMATKKSFARVLGREYIDCQNIRTIGSVLWPVHRSRTDRQTYKPRWPIYFAKNRRFSQSNKVIAITLLCKIKYIVKQFIHKRKYTSAFQNFVWYKINACSFILLSHISPFFATGWKLHDAM